ncbi:MAG: hypothetical protein LPK26_04655 [Bacillaceae bacterium]|nr:hypothetical protein [Bacillaceae bacterium]
MQVYETRVPVKMIKAYQLLYEIETILKSNINQQLIQEYGIHWRTVLHEKRPLNETFLHELVSYLFKYPHIFPKFNDTHRMKLKKLNDVRNKVCHMEDITSKELKLIKDSHKIIMKYSR